MDEKKLYRSDRDKMFLGICGGLGEYLNVDSTLIRLLYAILILAGPGIFLVFLYFVAAIIIPRKAL